MLIEKLMIKKLFPGHAMHESGRFLIGDILLAINDQILDGMTYQEAIAVIRCSPMDVTIIAKRPHRDEIPSELFETSRPVSPEKLLKDSKHLSGYKSIPFVFLSLYFLGQGSIEKSKGFSLSTLNKV